MNLNTNKGFGPDSIPMSSQTLQMSDCVNIVWRRKWWAIAIFVVVVGIVAVKNFDTIPVYEATTNLLIDKQYLTDNTIDSVMSREELTQEYYQTQFRLLESNSLIREVIKALGLGQGHSGPEVVHREMSNVPSNMSEMVDWGMPDLFDWYSSNLRVE